MIKGCMQVETGKDYVFSSTVNAQVDVKISKYLDVLKINSFFVMIMHLVTKQ